MKVCSALLVLLVALIAGIFCCQAGEHQNQDGNYPVQSLLTQIYSPFKEPGRERYVNLQKRIFSRFGVYRITPQKGHRHAGIDLQGSFGEKVFAIGPGVVVRDYWIFPNRAIAVQHVLGDGSSIYSAYVHIEDIKVRVGQQVDETTELGRIFTQAEMRRARYRSPPHLHLEIRNSMFDDGRSSFSSMTMPALNEYCRNPETFMRSLMR